MVLISLGMISHQLVDHQGSQHMDTIMPQEAIVTMEGNLRMIIIEVDLIIIIVHLIMIEAIIHQGQPNDHQWVLLHMTQDIGLHLMVTDHLMELHMEDSRHINNIMVVVDIITEAIIVIHIQHLQWVVSQCITMDMVTDMLLCTITEVAMIDHRDQDVIQNGKNLS